jgi:hypothetical protein
MDHDVKPHVDVVASALSPSPEMALLCEIDCVELKETKKALGRGSFGDVKQMLWRDHTPVAVKSSGVSPTDAQAMLNERQLYVTLLSVVAAVLATVVVVTVWS